ncbi:MAG: PIN domain-containing protein [Pirellulales bacterium]|nr:PIN domain-containing protein [Pirellulales bacterium]
MPTTEARSKQYLRSHGRFTFSHISCFEILRGLRKRHAPQRIDRFTQFCQRSELLPVTYEVIDLAATLWADGKQRGVSVEDSDLMIAATAILEKIPLITANPRHFSWIADLQVANWRE